MITASQTVDADEPFTWPARRALLTAEWRHLAMLNFAVDRSIVAPLVPAGTELDDWNGESYASVIGFQFLRTTFYGVPVPYHSSFVEVNLRFYIRRRSAEGCGVRPRAGAEADGGGDGKRHVRRALSRRADDA